MVNQNPKQMNLKLFPVAGVLILLLWACTASHPAVKPSASITPRSTDSTEYEILITDLHFEQWYLLNYNQAKDYTNDYYRNKNLIAAGTWNEYYRTGRYTRVIDSSVDYQPTIDYGIEVNRKLYWYFRYVTEQYKIRLFGSPVGE
jgi:hypothetical protein